MGKSAPERPNIGKTTKFMISWNPCMSSIFEAIAMPNAAKQMPMSVMKRKAMTNPVTLLNLVPIRSAITRMIAP